MQLNFVSPSFLSPGVFLKNIGSKCFHASLKYLAKLQKPLKITIWYEEHFGQIFQLKYFRRILKRIFVHRITSLFRLWYVYSPGND